MNARRRTNGSETIYSDAYAVESRDRASRYAHALRVSVLKANYCFGRYLHKVWLIGEARSGTTWVSELLAQDRAYREVFEPLHPWQVPELRYLRPFQYIRPNEQDAALEPIVRDTFSGRRISHRSDSANRRLLYDGILVKDVYANLYAKWAISKVPGVRVILLIRHPMAVLQSKIVKKQWFEWTNDLTHILSQESLMTDHLEPYRSVIEKAARRNDFNEVQLILWVINNRVPLRQFEADQMHIVFYEDLYEQPDVQLRNMRRFLGVSEERELNAQSAVIRKPSRKTDPRSTISGGESPITGWMKRLDSSVIEDGMAVLDAMGWNELYGSDGRPNHRQLEAFGQSSRVWKKPPRGTSYQAAYIPKKSGK